VNQDIEFYQARDAAELISSTPKEVARLGQILIPEVPADGSGHRSLYSFRNLVEMRLSDKLARMGVSWKRISKYIDALRASYGRWLDKDGFDGWFVLDSSWNWGAGTTLNVAAYTVFKGNPQDMFIAIDIGVIKQAIRRAMDHGGDSLTDEELSETINEVENRGNQLKEERG
jgi:hypothetical protein